MENQRWNVQPRASASRLANARLTDSVVELRPLAVIDAGEHLAGEDEELIRWLKGAPGTLQGTLEWLNRCEQCWRLGGPVFAFGIRDVGREVLLGTVELRVGETCLEPRQASISYGLYPQARGRGVAVRACRLACTFALRALTTHPWAIREVMAEIHPFNAESLRVAHRAGFQHVDLCVGAGAAWELLVMDLTRRLPPAGGVSAA